MRTSGFSLFAIALVQLVAAQPHARHHHRRSPQEHTVVDVVTVTGPEVVVVVDQNGNPISTYTESAPSTTTAQSTIPVVSPVVAAQVTSSSSSSIAAPSSTSSSSSSSTLAPPPPSSSSSSSSTSAAAVSSTSSAAAAPSVVAASGNGIAYTPRNDDNSCKSQDTVNADFAKLASAGYAIVRLYGYDCDQITKCLAAGKSKGIKLVIGTLHVNQLDTELTPLIAAAKNDWASISMVYIGNEVVNSGAASPAQVVAAVSSARGSLSAAGYTGSVVAVDTWVAVRDNPTLCTAGDALAMNMHPFFDGNVLPANCGSFMTTQIANVAKVCTGKTIIITETGWPHQGGNNGVSYPSRENQQTCIASIKSAFASNPSGVYFFTQYDEPYKSDNAYTHGAEKFWGIM
ncbi:MAG: hypothetical protein M1829_004809 [Trizodia sp. TS-e1964]|nr:MAG: hypothetical protein M1829_004809 [Trizodia sp. TS-e1964]